MSCRIRAAVLLHFFALASFLHAPAIAESQASGDDLTLSPSSDWKLRTLDDKCRLTRTFGEGENETTLWFDQGSTNPIFNLTLIGRPLRNPYGPAIRIKFGDEEEVIRSYIASKSSKGRPALSMFGVTLVQPAMELEDDAAAPEIAIGAERAAAIQKLRLRNAIREPVTLELGAMSEPFGLMQGCAQVLEQRLSLASIQSGQTSPPKPLNIDEWIRSSDYPDYLVRSEMEGLIDIRLTVAKTGRATSCFVTKSNKPQLFDDTVCLGVMKRARFAPARNAKGAAVASYFTLRTRFALQ